jgi:thiamine monophosphate kinase
VLSDRLDLPLIRIGEIRAGSDMSVLDASGQEIGVSLRGWQHF